MEWSSAADDDAGEGSSDPNIIPFDYKQRTVAYHKNEG